MSEIKVVIFDAGGVLHEANTVVTDELAKELDLQPAVLEDIWATEIPLLNTGKIDEQGFWEQVGKRYSIRHVDVAEDLLGRAFAEALKPRTEVLELVKTLGKKGVTRAVLSNTIEPHARALREAGVYDGFDRLFLSHEVGLSKPHTSIYQYAMEELAVEPAEAVFIDDVPAYVAPAQALGMYGIVFTSPEQLAADLQQLIPDLDLDL